MTSSPPSPRDSTPPALARLSERVFRSRAADECVLFVCLDGAPREACHTRVHPDGISFETRLKGRIVAIGPDSLRLATDAGEVLVRYLLPGALDLSALHDRVVSVDVIQRYKGPGRATVDAEVRDADGQLLLWAHDGRMPSDAHGLAFRLTVAEGHRLAIGHTGGVACLASAELGRVRAGTKRYDVAVLRVGADDVAFVVLRA